MVDSPGRDCLADIYVRAHYRRVEDLFLWRVSFEPSLFDSVGRAFPLVGLRLPVDSVSLTGSGSPAAAKLDALLADRTRNRLAAQTKAGKIILAGSLAQVLEILRVPVQGEVADSPDRAAETLVIPPLAPASSGELVLTYSEDFETTPVGGYPAGWTQLSPSSAPTKAVVNRAFGPSLSFGLDGLTNSPRTDGLACQPQGDRFAYEFDMLVEGDRMGGMAGFTVPFERNGQAGRMNYNQVQFLGDSGGRRKLIFCGLSAQPHELMEAQVGVWYSIRVDMDFREATARVTVNGQVVGEGLPILTNQPRYDPNIGGMARLETFSFSTDVWNGDPRRNKVRFDNLKFWQ